MAGAKELLETAKGIRLLYVEDDQNLREDTLRLLSTFFQNITVAENGKEAFENYQPGRYDIVISDLIMPMMSGSELTKRIKALNPEQIIVILSAHDEMAIVNELNDAGVDFFIFKPLEINQFINILYDSCLMVRKRAETKHTPNPA
ncbi:MAG: response regulator [Deltaproteobacteria bacterium]|nr:response regulator [Deltaproteobacteria bacterium]